MYTVRVMAQAQDEGGKAKVANLGEVAVPAGLAGFCRGRGIPFVRDLTKGGGGYGVDPASGGEVFVVGAAGLAVVVSSTEEALTLAREAEVRGQGSELAALRRARRQAQATALRVGREAAEASVAQALAEFSQTLAGEDEQATAAARQHLQAIHGGGTLRHQAARAALLEDWRQAENWEARRTVVLLRRELGQRGRFLRLWAEAEEEWARREVPMAQDLQAAA